MRSSARESPVTRCWGEVKRFFSSKPELDEKMTVQTFYEYKFALVIDLRSHQDNLTGHELKVVNTVWCASGDYKEGYHGKHRV